VPAHTADSDTRDELQAEKLHELVTTLLFRIPLDMDKGSFRAAEAGLQRGMSLMSSDCQVMAALAICLAAGRHKFITAEKLARQAQQVSPYEPWGTYALGRVYLLGGRRYQAFRSFYKALKMAPDDARLEVAVAGLDRRRPPVVTMLSREHRLNVALGKIRSFLVTDHSFILAAVLGLLCFLWIISLAYR
jgi:Flp pilus assembly protein TadD